MLKGASIRADESGMFLRRTEPILLTEEGLAGLCASLNRPVVDIEDLPVGPARAAIVLHRDAGGRRSLAVALRSEESGAVALFEFQGELNSDDSQVMDAGLAFAESMGFLFDDDLIASEAADGRQRAADHWYELTGEELVAPAPEPLRPDRPIAADDAAFDLDQLSDLIDDDVEDLGDDLDDFDDLEEELLQPLAPQGASVLTKFRQASDPAPAGPATPSRTSAEEPVAEGAPAQLGRIAVVRRRPEEGTAAPSLMTRLLASF
jgi:hypothetical protein